MSFFNTLSHWIFRILSAALGLACFWSIVGEASLVMTIFMVAVGSVFLTYGLYKSDLVEELETVGRSLLSKKYSRDVS